MKNKKIKRILINDNYIELTENTFLYHIDLFINEFLNYLNKEEGLQKLENQILKKFISYVNITPKFKNSTKKLIKIFFNKEEYSSTLKNTVKNTNYFEILLYAYRFSILCSLAEKNSIFSRMIDNNFIKEINKSYIPGTDLYCDLFVESYINMSKPISEIHESGYCNGYYICDCGEYYFQIWCGVPTSISNCANCHKEIGGLKEKLIIRKEDNGQYKIKRIYPNEENKKKVEERRDLKRIYGPKLAIFTLKKVSKK